MSETRKKLEPAGEPDDTALPDREGILGMSMGFRPGDPFKSMIKFKMAQYSESLKWLEANRPTGKPIRGALFLRCEELTREYLRIAAKSAAPGQPLYGEELENYALLMDLFNVPLLNAHMALAAARRKPRGAKIVVPRDIVISAAEMRFQGKSWGQIAKVFPKYKPNSIRKAARTLEKFCRALAIPVPPKRGKI